VHGIDDRAYRATARMHAPLLDRILPRLSHLADRSVLWTLIAVLLGLAGRRERRGALRGLVSIGAASAIGHAGALVLGRRRPDVSVVPMARRVRRHPVSASFPSRHTASAFAFATSVALERPAFAVPIFGLAGAVAYSRIYIGAHYPSDVLAGAALGSAVAVGTRLVWPEKKRPAARTGETVGVRPPRPDGAGISVVVNQSSGSSDGDLESRLREDLPAAYVRTLDGADLRDALDKAARADVVGVAGGDGTVNVAAGVALDARKPLWVVPGGTLNHFARDLGLESVDDAMAAARSGAAASVDVGCIAGRVFVNTASFGSYADLVDMRERLEDRIGKWPAAAVAAVRVFFRAKPVPVEVDGKTMEVWAAFIGNGEYRPAGFAPAWRERLDDGRLDFRAVVAGPRFARVRLIAALMTGRLSRSKVYVAKLADGPIRVRSLDGPLRLATDGETFTGPEEFTISKADDRLVVLVPEANGPAGRPESGARASTGRR
jgi:undecaprenyl-diphosphatase